MDPITPPSDTPQDNSAIAPGLDNELDAALSKSFSNNAPPAFSDDKPNPGPSSAPEKKEPELKKETPPQDSKKPVEKPVVNEELPDPDKIDQAPPSGKSQHSKTGWDALRNNYKRAHKTLQEKDGEIEKLKSLIAEKESFIKKESEGWKREKTDLEKYRAMIDIQADPEFLSKFDKPIEKSVTDIKKMLKEMNVTEEVINQIDWANTKLLEEIVGHVSSNRDGFTARKMERKIQEFLDLTDKRNEAIEENKKNYNETLEKRKKEAYEKSTESEGRMIKHLEALAAQKDKDGNPLIPFISKQEVKDGADPGEVNRINNHNALVDSMNKKIKEFSSMTEPEDRAEVMVAAAASFWLKSKVNHLEKQLAKAQEEIKKINNVSSEREGRPTQPIERPRNGELVDLDTALGDHFRR